jgi:hypothetical protein
MVISTVYPDGTVAALEELIGNHGGLGGEQTDAFLFHPPDVVVPDTRNSTDVFHILNGVRGTPVPPKVEAPQAGQTEIGAWSPSNLARGIGQVGAWIGRALRALLLDRTAYQEVARDALMTGPALLLGLLAVVIDTLVMEQGSFDPLVLAGRFAFWLLSVLMVFIAGRMLSKKGEFTRTFRAVGFAQAAWLLGVLTLIPPIAPLTRLITVILAFFAVWIGAAEAHETKGWRTILLPAMVVIAWVVVAFVVGSLVAGAGYTVEALLGDVGMTAPQ